MPSLYTMQKHIHTHTHTHRITMSTLSRELGFLARRNLAQILDLHSSTGIDWRGLVDKMGFSYEMNMLLSTKPSPTLSLLEEWERVLGKYNVCVLLNSCPF